MLAIWLSYVSQAIDFNHSLNQTILPYLSLVITAIMCYYWLCYYFHRKNLKPYNYNSVFTNTCLTPVPSLAKISGDFYLPFRSFVQKQSLHQLNVPQQKKKKKQQQQQLNQSFLSITLQCMKSRCCKENALQCQQLVCAWRVFALALSNS